MRQSKTSTCFEKVAQWVIFPLSVVGVILYAFEELTTKNVISGVTCVGAGLLVIFFVVLKIKTKLPVSDIKKLDFERRK
jgi:hypothetical protein